MIEVENSTSDLRWQVTVKTLAHTVAQHLRERRPGLFELPCIFAVHTQFHHPSTLTNGTGAVWTQQWQVPHMRLSLMSIAPCVCLLISAVVKKQSKSM